MKINTMKLSLFTFSCAMLCLLLFINQPAHSVELGDVASKKAWVYLCGLTNDFQQVPEIQQGKVLDAIGLRLGMKFIAIEPRDRCAQLGNRLCWAQETPEEVQKTYHYIMESVGKQPIAGFVGFSNGGFFLNALAQTVKLDVPLVAIGSAGYIRRDPFANTIHLLIGKQDEHHYKYAIAAYEHSKKTNVTMHLTEYDGGHEIPENELLKVLQKFQ